MKRRFLYILLAVVVLVACSKSKKTYDEIGSSGLTTRTENLQHNMLAYEEKGAMLGQMYATAEGIGWMDDSCQSDLNKVTGDNPAVIGYELAGIENNKTQNSEA